MKHAFMGLATLLGGFLTISHEAQAQASYSGDALLYMRQGPSGTARSLGLAGANVSLGADFGNLTSNPAGLGFYTKSELTLTPAVGYGTSSSTQIANAAAVGSSFPSQSQTNNSFHIANAGVVFASRRPDNDQNSDWRGGAFALGFTRLADYNQTFGYQSTTDDNHSLFQRLREPALAGDRYTNYLNSGYQDAATDIYRQYANSAYSSQYTNIDGLAYGTGLTRQQGYIRRNPNGTVLDTIYQVLPTLARTGNITQTEIVKSTGSLSQFDLGYGGNYRDRLYIGGGIGIVSLNRTRTSSFSESSGGAQDFVLDDYLKTTGTGVNARLGLIYRAADAVRLGASIQTPTYIHLTDEYSTTLTTNNKYTQAQVANGIDAVNTLSTAPGSYDYSITTPFRANGGATVLFNKYGFLTADVEYVGYSKATYNTTDGTTDAGLNSANSEIAAGYKNVVNVRVGAEGRFDIFRARLGYARYADPYKNSSYDRAQNYFSAGVGVRTKSFFVDLAGIYLTTHDQYQPYTLYTAEVNNNTIQRASPTINTNANRFTASLTGGLVF